MAHMGYPPPCLDSAKGPEDRMSAFCLEVVGEVTHGGGTVPAGFRKSTGSDTKIVWAGYRVSSVYESENSSSLTPGQSGHSSKRLSN